MALASRHAAIIATPKGMRAAILTLNRQVKRDMVLDAGGERGY